MNIMGKFISASNEPKSCLHDLGEGLPRFIGYCREGEKRKTKKPSDYKNRKACESDRRGSNPRSRPWQGRALPTTPLSHLFYCALLCISDMIDNTTNEYICQQFFKKNLNLCENALCKLKMKKLCVEKLRQ